MEIGSVSSLSIMRCEMHRVRVQVSGARAPDSGDHEIYVARVWRSTTHHWAPCPVFPPQYVSIEKDDRQYPMTAYAHVIESMWPSGGVFLRTVA